MLRRLIVAFAAATCVQAAILTDNLGAAKRVSLEKPKIVDQQIWDEYGLSEAETGRYESASGKPFTATAWRLKDPTGAQAAFRWLRPPDAKPGNADALGYSKFAVANAGTLLMTFGNYLIQFEGSTPTLDELKIFLFQLPKVDQSALPPVLEYIPKSGLIPGSDRFISGPASLQKFFNKITPSVAGFHFGAEALVARFRLVGTECEMAVFYYPTNQMARDRQPEFEKQLPGAMIKRTGPLLAIIPNATNQDDAERLIAQVNYKAQVTINEGPPGKVIGNVGDMLVAIFQLVGVLVAIALVAGVGVFSMRTLRKRAAGGKDEDPMTMLHIDDQR